jgi:hypothetical protein
MWRETGDDELLREAVKSGRDHWLKTAQQLVKAHRQNAQILGEGYDYCVL